MDAVLCTGLNNIFCAVYFLSMACINCIMYLFSSFYRKKFNQASPRAGFIIAALSALGYVLFLFVTVMPHSAAWGYVHWCKTGLLVLSAAASMWGCVYLFYTMKRTRK